MKCLSLWPPATHSDYILANNENITVTASSVFSSTYTSSDAKLDMRTLRSGGWVGAAGASDYSLNFDLLDVYMIQGIVFRDTPGQGRVKSVSISHRLLDSLTENYFLNPVEITLPSAASLAWIDIKLPFVASHVTITFNEWDPPAPGCSLELVGYKFYEKWTDTHYLGTRDQVQNASSISTVFSTSSIASCVDTCWTNGFNYFMINEEQTPVATSAVCSCLEPSVSTRDFHTDHSGSTCLDSQPCMVYGQQEVSLYSTACKL
ncbi:hypothetical protein ElyMa_001250900 [Elysia marginata]|uniref:Uncharacterized protein n=1 Tax=Elysia marginata TaxID=1093978 RepID=A0AAV4ID95_9GAST|nr:hypothetical protein ElyMa_001250900 [Elysia marginata]